MSNIFEDDVWGKEGKIINSPECIDFIKESLEKTPIIIQHWFYKGSRSPNRICIDDFDAYKEYLEKNVRPGDIIEIWSWNEFCTKENMILEGKFPDKNGRIPKMGAY